MEIRVVTHETVEAPRRATSSAELLNAFHQKFKCSIKQKCFEYTWIFT